MPLSILEQLRGLKIEFWPSDKLIPYARNSRTHSDEQIAQVAASIRQFGWTNPILVAPDGVIIAGHARLSAGRKLGITEVPVIVLAHLSENDRRALVLADNQIPLNAGWDEEMLRLELESLRDANYNLDVLAFSKAELDAALALPEEDQGGLTDDDAIPADRVRVITAPGDLWVLDDHRLLCGDATKPADIERVLAGGLADMVFTDPPYNVDYEGKTAAKLKISGDAQGRQFQDFLRIASGNILAVTKGAIYICMSSSELHTLYRAFTEAGGHWSTFVIWVKHHFTLGRSDYQRQYEPILYGWREGTDHFWCGARDQGDVWFIKKPVANHLHPTMKPVELVDRALRNSSKSRDTVLDPFGGSGSTLIACERSGRQARLIEMEPKYCDVIIRRWQEHTGQEATLEGDGRLFREIARERQPPAA